MGHKTRIQAIKRKSGDQYYVNLPSALAQSLDILKGETVEWLVLDCSSLILRRKSNNGRQEPMLKALRSFDGKKRKGQG